jgi:hypothetical protein
MPYVRMRTRRSKLIRSWPMYLTVVLITFLVAMAVSKCMAYADTVIVCDFYRDMIRAGQDGAPYRAKVHLEEMTVKVPPGYTGDQIKEIVAKNIVERTNYYWTEKRILVVDVKCKSFGSTNVMFENPTSGFLGRKF